MNSYILPVLSSAWVLLLGCDATPVGPHLLGKAKSVCVKHPLSVDTSASAGVPLDDSKAHAYGEGFTRGTDGSFICDAGIDGKGSCGVSWGLDLNQTEAIPFMASAWARVETATGAADRDFSIYLDISYTDGSSLWGQSSAFDPEQKADWQWRQVQVFPEKPVKRVNFYLLFRNHPGRVRFRDPRIQTMTPGSIALFDGVPVTTTEALIKPTFLVRDVAAASGFYSIPPDGTALGLKLDAVNNGSGAYSVTLTDTTGKDRAVTLYYVVPLPKGMLTWFEGPRTSKVLTPASSEQSFANRIDDVGNGRLSRWPLAAMAVSDSGDKGLAIGIDPATPAFFRVSCNAQSRELFIAFDLGLAPEKNSASLRFVSYGFPPPDGFRGALAKYMELFPEAFTVRIHEQGNWMPFARVSQVEGWQDFGFRFKEGDDETAWDDTHGLLTFRYTEPMTWWMTVKGGCKTFEAAEAEARRLAAAGNISAKAWLACAFQNEHGRPPTRLRNTPWCNGAVWSMNSAPGIVGEINDWNLKNSKDSLAARYKGDPPNGCDGEYVDSAEAYVTDSLDFRRDHFAAMDTPLCFSSRNCRVCIYKGMIGFEYVRGLERATHSRNRYMMANSTPQSWSWLAPLLDVLGTETNWHPNNEWQPMSDTELMYRRCLCGAKPYCFLMNTDFSTFTKEMSEKYMQRCLAYGMFPGYFSADASTGHYFTRPELYNRDRPLFKKYIPLCKRVAEAGWEPLTGVKSDNPLVTLERFGGGPVYLTVLNQSGEPQTAVLTAAAPLADPKAIELVTGTETQWANGQCSVSLAPDEARVFLFK